MYLKKVYNYKYIDEWDRSNEKLFCQAKKTFIATNVWKILVIMILTIMLATIQENLGMLLNYEETWILSRPISAK